MVSITGELKYVFCFILNVQSEHSNDAIILWTPFLNTSGPEIWAVTLKNFLKIKLKYLSFYFGDFPHSTSQVKWEGLKKSKKFAFCLGFSRRLQSQCWKKIVHLGLLSILCCYHVHLFNRIWSSWYFLFNVNVSISQWGCITGGVNSYRGFKDMLLW